MKHDISARLTSDWASCRFTLPEPVHKGGAVYFASKEQAAGSPLVESLFGLPGVKAVKVGGDSVTVTREEAEDWPKAARALAQILRRHLASGQAALSKDARPNIPSPEEIREKVNALLEEQINPAVAGHGGSIHLVEVKGATVVLRMAGGCQGCASSKATLKGGVERALRDAIPELDDIVDVTDHPAGENPYYA